MPTLICVPLFVEDVDSALSDANEAKRLGADLVEWRIDLLFSGEGPEEATAQNASYETAQIERLIEESPLPCIVTCRPTWEGGEYDGDDMARISLFERLGTSEAPPRYIDVELAAYTRSSNLRQKVNLAVEHPKQLRDVHTALILSLHDFDGRPHDLTRRSLVMRDEPAASVHKIAYRARSLRDNLELFDLLAHRDRPMIALGMGEFGLMSRVLAPKFGAFLTFATLRSAEITAPGQPTILELLETYHFRSIGPTTRVYGVIGWPVTHSKGPLVHNAGFEHVRHDGVYLPLPVGAGEDGEEGAFESFKGTLLALIEDPRLDFAGASVTLPHKEHLARLAQERGWHCDEATRITGAANTIAIDPDRVLVLNTDAGAIAACLHDRLVRLEDKRILVLGAGGAARAAVFACAAAGAHVTIMARTHTRAEALAADLANLPGRIDVAEWTSAPVQGPEQRLDAVINCTPVGMTGGPASDQAPIDLDGLRASGPVVFDTVYAPPEPPLLERARALGLGTIDGAEMFIRQASAQFEAWTGVPAPAELFTRLVRNET